MKLPVDGAASKRTRGRDSDGLISRLVRRLARDDTGATAVEYALILGGIAAVILAVVYVFGAKTNNLYNNTASSWP